MTSLSRLALVALLALPSSLLAGCTDSSSIGGTNTTNQECTPGQSPTKKAPDGCNTCACQQNGFYACTELACGGGGSSGGGGSAGGSGGCTPGQTKKADDGCNSCSCLADGSWACTTIGCVPACTTDADCPQTKEACHHTFCVAGSCQQQETNGPGCLGNCTPGETKDAGDGCNTCTCQPDGTYVCTQGDCGVQCKSNNDCLIPLPAGCINHGCVQGLCDIQCGGAGSCKADSDCASSCTTCNGNTVCAQGDCVNGTCSQPTFPPCAPPTEKPCKVDNDCPPIDSNCSDSACVNGVCKVVSEPGCGCTTNSDCNQSGMTCADCAGIFSCSEVVCNQEGESGVCEFINVSCDASCNPQDIQGVGPCDAFFGYSWTGTQCVPVGGCSCAGKDCNKIYKDATTCQTVHQSCFIPD